MYLRDGEEIFQITMYLRDGEKIFQIHRLPLSINAIYISVPLFKFIIKIDC